MLAIAFLDIAVQMYNLFTERYWSPCAVSVHQPFTKYQLIQRDYHIYNVNYVHQDLQNDHGVGKS